MMLVEYQFFLRGDSKLNNIVCCNPGMHILLHVLRFGLLLLKRHVTLKLVKLSADDENKIEIITHMNLKNIKSSARSPFQKAGKLRLLFSWMDNIISSEIGAFRLMFNLLNLVQQEIYFPINKKHSITRHEARYIYLKTLCLYSWCLLGNLDDKSILVMTNSNNDDNNKNNKRKSNTKKIPKSVLSYLPFHKFVYEVPKSFMQYGPLSPEVTIEEAGERSLVKDDVIAYLRSAHDGDLQRQRIAEYYEEINRELYTLKSQLSNPAQENYCFKSSPIYNLLICKCIIEQDKRTKLNTKLLLSEVCLLGMFNYIAVGILNNSDQNINYNLDWYYIQFEDSLPQLKLCVCGRDINYSNMQLGARARTYLQVTTEQRNEILTQLHEHTLPVEDNDITEDSEHFEQLLLDEEINNLIDY